MTGIIALLPSAPPRFVSLSDEILSLSQDDLPSEVALHISEDCGFDGYTDFRLLFRGKDLETNAGDFLELAGSGQPCTVRVVFRLLGGKGGFGSLLRGQKGRGRKTTDLDAMRDLSGRRLRHAKAVERIKEWMEKNRREDELVDALIGEGPELPKPVPASETLDPDFLRTLKRSTANRSSLVGEGLRKLENVGGPGEFSDAVDVVASKRAKSDVASSSAGWNALSSLGSVSSEEERENSDEDVCEKHVGGACSSSAEPVLHSSSAAAVEKLATSAPTEA